MEERARLRAERRREVEEMKRRREEEKLVSIGKLSNEIRSVRLDTNLSLHF